MTLMLMENIFIHLKYVLCLFIGKWYFSKVDERIVSKIRELVSEGVRSVKEVERHLKIHPKNEFFRGKAKPTQENRRFYPERRDIINHMYLATVKLTLSKIDQVNLEQKVEECLEAMARLYKIRCQIQHSRKTKTK